MTKITLVNKKASPEAAALYNYILTNYGKRIISGVQETPGRHHDLEVEYIYNATGKLPAIRGFDFIHDDYNGVVRRAKEWSLRGGIVTICWHTGVFGNSYQAAKEERPDFNRLFKSGTHENERLLYRWELAASALNNLQEAGIPVLWRPFHEFDGQWFWWGAIGTKCFKQLWQTMFEKFTFEYKLNNLIWVLGYSGDVRPGWYVGDNLCDICGSDVYNGSVNLKGWRLCKSITDKPLAFHECGRLPKIDDFFTSGALWSWFMNWHTSYLMDNSPEKLDEIYSDPRVITLEDYIRDTKI